MRGDVFNKIRKLTVETPQGLSGELSKEARYVFRYTSHEPAAAVSLMMPLRSETYASGDLPGVFSMNRPEGYLRYRIEDHFRRLGVPDDMFLLYLGGKNQIGRLNYLIDDDSDTDESPEKLSDILSETSTDVFEYLLTKYALRSGVSGVQPKTVVPVERGTIASGSVIVKVAGQDYPGLCQNEFFCMSVAKAAGCKTPDFWLSDDGQMFVMSRFDRAPDGQRIGFEDMAVLTGRNAQTKYQGSYEMIAKALAMLPGGAAGMEDLFARVLLSARLYDGDAHLKNFGVIYEHPGAAVNLAPVYDVVCTRIYPELEDRPALKLGGAHCYPDQQTLAQFAEALGVTHLTASRIADKIESGIHATIEQLRSDPRFQDGLLDKLHDAIFRISPAPKQAKKFR